MSNRVKILKHKATRRKDKPSSLMLAKFINYKLELSQNIDNPYQTINHEHKPNQTKSINQHKFISNTTQPPTSNLEMKREREKDEYKLGLNWFVDEQYFNTLIKTLFICKFLGQNFQGTLAIFFV